MSVDPTISIPDSKVPTAESIFSLVVQNESFFSDIGSLPDIRGFLSDHARELREILIERWQTILGGSALPLVVNILINPNIFFSHRDAVRGQYHKYFRPIYLDRNAIAIDDGNFTVFDPAASAVVNFHKAFDVHYGQALHGRASFLSLNDIEAALYAQGDKSPFPTANTVVSIFQTGGELDTPNYSIFLDGNADFKSQVLERAVQCRLNRATEYLHAYLSMITGQSVSYHHVTIGSRQTWLGRLYLAFRSGQAESGSGEWISRVKIFALEVVTQLASAGMLIRNKNIIEMLADLRNLLSHIEGFRTLHSRTIDQFSESATARKRNQLPSHDEMEMDLSSFASLTGHRLTSVHRHITQAKCTECERRISPTTTLRHAVKDCKCDRETAGEAFVSDALRMVHGAFEPLPQAAKEFIAHSLAFGILADRDRPKVVVNYCEILGLSRSWRMECGSRKEFEEDLPQELVPYIRALAFMTGNPVMVRSNIENLELTVTGSPRLEVEGHANPLLIRVLYPVAGTLNSQEEKVLDLLPPSELNQDRARLLLYFGSKVFDDFQMCVATASGGRLLTCRTVGWKGPPAWTDQHATYAFQISI